MTEQIIVTINPAPDGVHCGECSYAYPYECAAFSLTRERDDDLRFGFCLAAARTLREEREAMRRVIEASAW